MLHKETDLAAALAKRGAFPFREVIEDTKALCRLGSHCNGLHDRYAKRTISDDQYQKELRGAIERANKLLKRYDVNAQLSSTPPLIRLFSNDADTPFPENINHGGFGL